MTSRLMKSLAAFLLLVGVMALPASADTLKAFIDTPQTILSSPLSFTGVPSLTISASPATTFDGSGITVAGVANPTLGPGLSFTGSFGGLITSGQSLDTTSSITWCPPARRPCSTTSR